jgi:hypothetical protein
MSTTLRDFIAKREMEIKELQKALKTELRDLQIAKSALGAQSVAHSSPPTAPLLTIKEMAKEVLASQPNGLSSVGILDGIRKQFGQEIERSSLSPQLSRLKAEGELALEDEVWFTSAHYQAYMAKQQNSWASASSEQPSAWASDVSIFDEDSEVPF